MVSTKLTSFTDFTVCGRGFFASHLSDRRCDVGDLRRRAGAADALIRHLEEPSLQAVKRHRRAQDSGRDSGQTSRGIPVIVQRIPPAGPFYLGEWPSVAVSQLECCVHPKVGVRSVKIASNLLHLVDVAISRHGIGALRCGISCGYRRSGNGKSLAGGDRGGLDWSRPALRIASPDRKIFLLTFNMRWLRPGGVLARPILSDLPPITATAARLQSTPLIRMRHHGFIVPFLVLARLTTMATLAGKSGRGSSIIWSCGLSCAVFPVSWGEPRDTVWSRGGPRRVGPWPANVTRQIP